MVSRPAVRLVRRIVLAGLCGLSLLGLVARARAAAPFVYVTTIDTDIVTPVLAQWIEEVIKRAEADGAEALVIQLDTPGGLLEATHDIVKDIMTARVPVMVYVAPSGSRAASAGTFITVCAHVAAMAPGTSIGAANVVDITGGSPADRPPEKKEPEEESPVDDSTGEAVRDLIDTLKDAFGDAYGTEEETEEEEPASQPAAETPEEAAPEAPPVEEPPVEEPAEAEPGERPQQETGTAMGDKILNDTIAWARTIAETRGRNADWMERAIVDSESITEDEALERNVIDFIAEDLRDALVQADGREIHLPGRRTVILATAEAEVRTLEMTFRYQFLGALAHPQILLLLLSLGGLGLTMELFNPNGITGVIGVVCLILAYFGLQTLPINMAGALLLLLALVLLIAEFMVTSYGLLTLGALVCFTLGGLMLIDSPDEVLSLQLRDVLPITLAVGAIAAFLVTLVIKSQRTHPVSGSEGMVGLLGEVREALDPRGKIEVRGELWNAECTRHLPIGTRVRITAVSGLTVTVEPVELPTATAAADAGADTHEGTA